MARKILFTSFKGGTGVTTVCVGIGLALAELGEKTLIADGDYISACAMTVSGMGNMQVYTFADYEKGACRAKQTAAPHPKQNNLHMAASLGMKDCSSAARALSEVQGLYDYILCDKIAAEFCDEAVLISEPYLPSLKSADCCRAALADGGIKDVWLAINKSNGGQVVGGEEFSPEQAAEILHMRLLAAVPEDPTLPVGKWQKRTVEAFRAAACALAGKSVRPFDVTKGYGGLNGVIKRKMRLKI